MPEMANIHIDVALTNLSVAYVNEDYVADDVFPIVPVQVRSDRYFVYNSAAFLRGSGFDANGKLNSLRRPGTRSEEEDYEVSHLPYLCEQYARNRPVTDAEVNLADQPLQPAMDTTIMLTEGRKIENEMMVAKKAMTRANYDTGNKVQLVTTTTSWIAATGKPLSVDIPNGKKAVFGGLLRSANRLLLNYDSAQALKNNAEYIERVKYVSKETLTNDGLVPVIDGLQPVIGKGRRITSAEGAANTSGYIWVDDQGQNSALVYYKPPSIPGLKMTSLGATFEAPDDTLNVRGFVVKRWREENIDSERVEVRFTRDWRFIGTDGSSNGDNSNGYATGGYLISGCTL
jgi:hypothetical protein